MQRIEIRPAKKQDARGILEAQYSAIHDTAAKDYSKEILAEWATEVTAERVERYLEESFLAETTLVAIMEGRIAGFGAIVESKNELRAVYVHAAFGRRGVGSSLLVELERLAAQRKCNELQMDSSITAAPFYAKHGYEALMHGTHTLQSGMKMGCVKMRKKLT